MRCKRCRDANANPAAHAGYYGILATATKPTGIGRVRSMRLGEVGNQPDQRLHDRGSSRSKWAIREGICGAVRAWHTRTGDAEASQFVLGKFC
jgi:hypothetical protein